MHNFLLGAIATDRHNELLREGARRRQFRLLRRRAQAERLTRKAADLNRRAESLVEQTHR